MDELSPVNRPVTLGELALVFHLSLGQMARLIAKHRILPACRIGRMRVYGPRQIQRIAAAMELTGPFPDESFVKVSLDPR